MNTILDSKYQARIVKKWAPMLNEGKKITDAHQRYVLAQVLENTHRDFARQGLINEAYDVQQTGDGARPATHGSILGTGAGRGDNGYLNGTKGYQNGINGTGTYGDFMIPNVVMPLLRRVFPDLMANELVGVQPMNGPIGYALALRAKYNYNGIVGDGRLNVSREIGGVEPPDTRYTGWDNGAEGELTGNYGPYDFPDDLSGQGKGLYANPHGPSEEHPNPSDKPLPEFPEAGDHVGAWTVREKEVANRGTTSADTKDAYFKAYLGDRKDYQGYGADVVPNTEYASLLDGTYPTVGFDLIKAGVEAKTRKLGAQWSPELAEDMQAIHGIDVEAEMVNILSYEIGAEIDRQILTSMVKAAITGGSVSTWNPAKADGLDQMGRLATLLTKITVEAQAISFRTRRGNANFVVTSPRVTGLLQQMTVNKYANISMGGSIPSVPQASGNGSLQKQGLINDGSQLLVRDAYAQGDYILMGYKGPTAQDSGLIYCPYIPLTLLRTQRHDTGTPAILARTRYGLMENPWDARLYYHFIKIEGLHDPYTWNDGERHFLA